MLQLREGVDRVAGKIEGLEALTFLGQYRVGVQMLDSVVAQVESQ